MMVDRHGHKTLRDALQQATMELYIRGACLRELLEQGEAMRQFEPMPSRGQLQAMTRYHSLMVYRIAFVHESVGTPSGYERLFKSSWPIAETREALAFQEGDNKNPSTMARRMVEDDLV